MPRDRAMAGAPPLFLPCSRRSVCRTRKERRTAIFRVWGYLYSVQVQAIYYRRKPRLCFSAANDWRLHRLSYPGDPVICLSFRCLGGSFAGRRPGRDWVVARNRMDWRKAVRFELLAMQFCFNLTRGAGEVHSWATGVHGEGERGKNDEEHGTRCTLAQDDGQPGRANRKHKTNQGGRRTPPRRLTLSPFLLCFTI